MLGLKYTRMKGILPALFLSVIPMIGQGQVRPPRSYSGWKDIGSNGYRVFVPATGLSSQQFSTVQLKAPEVTSDYGTDSSSKTDKEQETLVVKTNMLYDAALAPNLGLEYTYNSKWSFGLDAWIAWIRNAKHNVWYQNYGFDVYGRYWFDAENTRPLTGYHLGAYVGTLTYDLYPEGKGYQCDKMFHTYRFGVEFGYAVPVGNRLLFDFYGGLGLLHTRQDVYYPNTFGSGYYRAYRRYRNLPDFTRFGITIGYVFGK